MKNIPGDTFECKKHGLDYRICCEECQEKYEKFSIVTQRMILNTRKIK